MRYTEERYISLLTDFGFKRIFGTNPNKDLLIDFLNSLFDGEQVVKNVTFLNSEHVGDVRTDRKAIFDVYCENEKGEKFIVEMQNASQKYFKDRSLYYATFPIREQAKKGEVWNYELKHVYVVALLNYDMTDSAFAQDTINHDIGLLDKQTHKVKWEYKTAAMLYSRPAVDRKYVVLPTADRRLVWLDKQTHRVFNDKLTFKYVEIAKFKKSIEELKTNYDKWIYVLQNLSRLDRQPRYLRTEVFSRLFNQAEIARFSKTELREYEDSLKAYRDMKNSLDNAEEKGIAKGLAKGRAEGKKDKAVEIAKKLLEMDMPIDAIMKATGLSQEEITKL